MMWLKSVLFIGGFIAVALFCKKQTDGFRIDKISSSLTFHPEWEVGAQDLAEVKEVLDQPFSYLGKGAQAFVFASQDGRYVIKFFRYDHMGEAPFLKKLPFERVQRRVVRLRAKLCQDFTSYKLAYDEMKEETGLVYLHLNKTDRLKQKIELIDKLGISHFLSLDELEFVVQKRAEPFYPALQKLMNEGKEKEAEELLSRLVALIVTRCQKEIFDKDPDLFTNFGVMSGRPIQIDPGRFKKDASESNPQKYKGEIIRITDKLHLRLEKEYKTLDKELQRLVHEIPT